MIVDNGNSTVASTTGADSNNKGYRQQEKPNSVVQEVMVVGKVSARPYDWPISAPINSKNTALVVIDMQKDFCDPDGYLARQGLSIERTRAIIPYIKELLDTFRTAGFPIYHTREGHRPDLSTLSRREFLRSRNNPSGIGIGDRGPMGRLLVRGEVGHDIIPELYPLPMENVIDKPGRSAFQHTDFRLLLNVAGIENLIICGATTDVCVTSTMRDANDNAFDCLLVSDATAAGREELYKAAISSVMEEGGIFGAVATTKSILHAFGKEMPEHLERGSTNSSAIDSELQM